MKKIKKIIVGVGIISLFFGFGMGVNAIAAENEEAENQVSEVVNNEEKVTIEMKLSEFQNKWLTPIVSGAMGLAGSLLGYFLYKKRYKIIMAIMTSGIKLTEEQRKKANEDLEKTKELYEQARIDFETKKNDYNTLMIMAKNEIEELKQYRIENIQFKELIGFLIASSPELANNGYAKKILMLLDEGKKIVDIVTEDVGDTDGTSN